MLRVVGEVADNVSSLRLVDRLPPNMEGTLAVFNESFGRFEGGANEEGRGAGERVYVSDGSVGGTIPRDMVLDGWADDEEVETGFVCKFMGRDRGWEANIMCSFCPPRDVSDGRMVQTSCTVDDSSRGGVLGVVGVRGEDDAVARSEKKMMRSLVQRR